MTEIEKHAQENVTRLLVGNKCDLDDKRQVRFEEGQELAKSYGINFIETSAKNSNNIEIAFRDIAKAVLEKVNYQNSISNVQNDKKVKLGANSKSIKNKKESSSCC